MAKRRPKKVSVTNAVTPVVKTGKRGGARANAGRPASALNKRTIAVRELTMKIIKGDKLPLRVMINNMIHYDEDARQREDLIATMLADNAHRFKPEEFIKLMELFAQAGDSRMKAQKCACDAAPYLHPRLSAMTIDVNKTVTHPRDIPPDASFEQIREDFRRMRAAPYQSPMVTDDSTGEAVEAELIEPEAEDA